MRTPARCGLAAACVVYLLATRAAAEPAPSERLRMRDPSVLTLKSGRVLELPPGRFIEEDAFQRMEAAYKAAQEKATRAAAERDSYRKTLTEEWRPGWKSLVVAFGMGMAYAKFVVK